MFAGLETAVRSVSETRIRAHLEALVGVRHPQADLAALQRAEAYVRDHFTAAGLDTQSLPFTDDGQRFHNIVGTSKGTERPNETALVLAHMDSVADSPGADDNASGVAVLLELATILGRTRFKRTVKFVGTNLEERSEDRPEAPLLRGTNALLDVIRRDKWAVTGVLDLEMVGFAGDALPQRAPAGMPVPVPKQGNFIALVANQASADLIRYFKTAVESFAPRLPLLPLVVPGRGEMLPDVRRSDHAAFWDADIPALMVTDTSNFRNPHYHQPTDTLETLNLAFMAEVARASAGALASLASL